MHTNKLFMTCFECICKNICTIKMASLPETIFMNFEKRKYTIDGVNLTGKKDAISLVLSKAKNFYPKWSSCLGLASKNQDPLNSKGLVKNAI